MISAELLRRLRNDLPMPVTIAALGREGHRHRQVVPQATQQLR